MTLEQIKLFHHNCRVVIQAAKNFPQQSNMLYASRYAEAGLKMDLPEHIQDQILYILSNLHSWKGEQARKVKANLKELQGV